jgi:hypothetical protein
MAVCFSKGENSREAFIFILHIFDAEVCQKQYIKPKPRDFLQPAVYLPYAILQDNYISER